MAVIKGTNGKDHLTSGSEADVVRGLKGNGVLVANGDDTLDSSSVANPAGSTAGAAGIR